MYKGRVGPGARAGGPRGRRHLVSVGEAKVQAEPFGRRAPVYHRPPESHGIAPTRRHRVGGGGGGVLRAHGAQLSSPPNAFGTHPRRTVLGRRGGRHGPAPPPPNGLPTARQQGSQPPKELWAIARVHKRQAVQSAERNLVRQWPIRPEVPFCHKDETGRCLRTVH